MANENLKRMLELSNKLDSSSKTKSNTTIKSVNKMTESELNAYTSSYDRQIEQLNEEVYGEYKKPDNNGYDAHGELNKLIENYGNDRREPTIDVTNSKLPKNIIESILSNPLNIDPTIVQDKRMTDLQERITDRMPGIKSIVQIQEKLDNHDKEKNELKEGVVHHNSNSIGNVDYDTLKTIVEDVFNDKINELKIALLNESVQHNGDEKTLKAMTFKNNKFLFLMDNNDIYECDLKYRGKNKKNG